MPLTNAERQARHRARIAERLAAIGTTTPPPTPKRPARTIRQKQWDAAINTLTELLDQYQDWFDRMPEAQQDGPTGQLLTDLLELREHVEALAAAVLPKGYGRD